MTNPKIVASPGSGSLLLRQLANSPVLPAYVRSLDPPVLRRLIEHVGVGDATGIIVHTTTAQLHDLFDILLWESLDPGRPEHHRPDVFLSWVDALLGAGAGFAGERLTELGEDFLAVNLQPLVRVYTTDVLMEHEDHRRCDCMGCRLEARDIPWTRCGDYLVTGVHGDEWDTVAPLLTALDDHDADSLQRVLARCCRRATVRGSTDDGHTAIEDAAAQRQARRESAGFVTPELAAIFLQSTREANPLELAREQAYDAITATCFQRQAATARSPGTPAALPDTASQREVTPAVNDSPGLDSPALAPWARRQLDDLLRAAEVLSDDTGGRTLRLAAPENSGSWPLPLQVQLDRLQTAAPDLFGARLGELVYLANVLMAGARVAGGRFEQAAAARAALACANLGFELLRDEQAGTRKTGRAEPVDADACLEAPPGLVRLFRVGWQALQAIPRRAGQALVEALRDEHLRAGLQRRAWILAEVESAISEPDLLQLIEQGEFEDVSDNLHLLTLILDQRACRCLQQLITDFPRYPVQLDTGLHHPRLENRESRDLATRRQLDKVARFLDELGRYLKG